MNQDPRISTNRHLYRVCLDTPADIDDKLRHGLWDAYALSPH